MVIPMASNVEFDDDLDSSVASVDEDEASSRPIDTKRLVRRHRRRPVEDGEESEEWVISYMDMVTLIMCAFVVIAALLDVQSTHAVGQFHPEQPTQPNGPALSPPSAIAPPDRVAASDTAAPVSQSDVGSDRSELTDADAGLPASPPLLSKEEEKRAAGEAKADAQTEAQWRSAIAGLGLSDRVAIEAKGRTITMQIQDEILFPVGDGDLGAKGQVVIRQLTSLLEQSAGQIHVEGHTDNVPIDNDRFASNWELSTTRASSVVRALIAAGISPDRLRATGYAETRPVQSNDTEAGRAHNRRVTLIIER